MVIMKFRSQLSIVSERAPVYLEKAEITLTRLQKSAAGELKEVRQQWEEVFRKLRASSRDALIVANERVTRLGSEVSSASRKVIVQVQIAQETAATLGRTGVDKVRKLRHESENELRRLGAGCHDAIVATGGTIAGLGSQVSAASKQVAMKLQEAQNAVTGLARTIADKPRRTREARWARENELRSLLASSLDAIVVTDSDRRLVAANAKALELFGISESNIRNFTLDAFVPNFDWSDPSFEGQEARLNRCKIRRLDGGLRVAECQFVAGIVPRRYLCKFLNVAPHKITLPTCAKGNASAASRNQATHVQGDIKNVPRANWTSAPRPRPE
jgi:PAS domain-containing protein